MKIFFILIVIPLIFCQPHTLKNALRNHVVTEFKNAIVPIISKQVEHFDIPDVRQSHIEVTRIHVYIAPFHPNQININFLPGTSALQFSGTGFQMLGTCHACGKVGPIHKCCDIKIGVTSISFHSQISLLSHNNKPNIRVDMFQINLSGVKIHEHCGFLTPIIHLIVRILEPHLIKEVTNQINKKAPAIMTAEVNKRLDTARNDFDIGPNLQMKVLFSAAPHNKGEYMFTGIFAFIHPRGNPTPAPYPVPNIPEFDPAIPRGVQFFLADYVIRSALDSSFKLGQLAYTIERDMLGHHIWMTCRSTTVPQFNFNNAIDSVVNGECRVIFDRNNANTFIVSADIHANIKEYAGNAIIFFAIQEVKFLRLEYKTDKPIDIEWFKRGINDVLIVFIALINADLGARGIPLPTIQGVDYHDMMQLNKVGYMEIGVNPHFHF